MHGILKLQRKVQGHPDLGWRERYQAEGTEEWPHPNAATRAPRLPAARAPRCPTRPDSS